MTGVTEKVPVSVIPEKDGYSRITILWTQATRFLRLTDDERPLMSIRRKITEEDERRAGRKLPSGFILLVQQVVRLDSNRNIFFSVPTNDINLWVEQDTIEAETSQHYLTEQWLEYRRLL
jgi:hypothetical protein